MAGPTFSGSRAQFWIGPVLLKVQNVKFGDKLNQEVVYRLGEQEIGARTEGQYEPDQVTGQVEVAIFYAQVLPQLPANGYGNFKFNGTLFVQHPQITTSVQVDLESCNFAGGAEEYKADPGAAMMDITINVDQVVRNGKTLNRRQNAPGGVGPSAAIGFAANISGATGLAGGFLF